MALAESLYNQRHEEEGNKVVGQGKEGSEESDRVRQRRATINQITSGKNSVPPKAKRNMTMEEESTSCLNKMSILVFSYPILLRSMSTRRLMKNPMMRHKRSKWG